MLHATYFKRWGFHAFINKKKNRFFQFVYIVVSALKSPLTFKSEKNINFDSKLYFSGSKQTTTQDFAFQCKRKNNFINQLYTKLSLLLYLESFVLHSISKKLSTEDDAEIFHRCSFKSRLGAILFKHRHLKRFPKSACRTRTGSQRDGIISEKSILISTRNFFDFHTNVKENSASVTQD